MLRLLVCVAGIYASFLSWALIQERLSTTPYYADPAQATGQQPPRYFRHVIFLNTVQSTFSALAALIYIASRKPRHRTWPETLGIAASKSPTSSNAQHASKAPRGPVAGSGGGGARYMLARCFQCALMASIGSPFGYAALRYIDYPTQILGKSCKLVPVMLMNIVLYRRKFALHKYLVVTIVTLGISMFMLCAPADAHGTGKAKKGAASNSLFGILLLLVNLLVDGAINSTQDEVFVRYKISGTQMMLWMNIFASIITATTMLVPFPSIPVINPSSASLGHAAESELHLALEFIRSHPQVLRDVLLFSLAGATGQLFIFDTLENFGSLTLVTITVTRKLFTMLLSLVVFNHHLTFGQWIGVFTVFAGIGIEAVVKRRESLEKRDKARLAKAKILKDGGAVGVAGIRFGADGTAFGKGLNGGAVTPSSSNSGRSTPIDGKQRLKDL